MLRGRCRQPRLTETDAATHRAGCDEARGATRSHSSSPPVPGSRRQSPPSADCSSAVAAAFPSEPPPDENCAHQLANYLAHDPPCSINRCSRMTPSPSSAASWGSGSAYRQALVAENQLTDIFSWDEIGVIIR